MRKRIFIYGFRFWVAEIVPQKWDQFVDLDQRICDLHCVTASGLGWQKLVWALGSAKKKCTCMQVTLAWYPCTINSFWWFCRCFYGSAESASGRENWCRVQNFSRDIQFCSFSFDKDASVTVRGNACVLQVEDALLREQIEAYNRRLREFEDRQRAYREEQERQAEAEAEVVQALLRFSENESDNDANGGAASSSKP